MISVKGKEYRKMDLLEVFLLPEVIYDEGLRLTEIAQGVHQQRITQNWRRYEDMTLDEQAIHGLLDCPGFLYLKPLQTIIRRSEGQPIRPARTLRKRSIYEKSEYQEARNPLTHSYQNYKSRIMMNGIGHHARSPLTQDLHLM